MESCWDFNLRKVASFSVRSSAATPIAAMRYCKNPKMRAINKKTENAGTFSCGSKDCDGADCADCWISANEEEASREGDSKTVNADERMKKESQAG